MSNVVSLSLIGAALLLAACGSTSGASGVSTAAVDQAAAATKTAPQSAPASTPNADDIANAVAATVAALQVLATVVPSPVATPTPPVASVPAAQATVQAFFAKADPTSAAVLAQLASAMDRAQPTMQAVATQNAESEATRAVEAETPKGQCEKWRGMGRRTNNEPQMSATILVTSVVSAQFAGFEPVSINTPCGSATLKSVRFATERDLERGYEVYASGQGLLLYEVEIVNGSYGEMQLFTQAQCVSRAGRTVSCTAGVGLARMLRKLDGGTFAHEGVVGGWNTINLLQLNDEGLAKVVIEFLNLGKIAIVVSK
jgi:hypothetical protein